MPERWSWSYSEERGFQGDHPTALAALAEARADGADEVVYVGRRVDNPWREALTPDLWALDEQAGEYFADSGYWVGDEGPTQGLLDAKGEQKAALERELGEAVLAVLVRHGLDTSVPFTVRDIFAVELGADDDE